MQKNDILRVRIEEINNLGFGVAHAEDKNGGRGQVMFVRGAVTGDLLDARIIKVNKSYLIAKIEKMIEPSSLRIEQPLCGAVGCGGCVYQPIRYEHEADLKRDYVLNAFRKAGLSDIRVGELCHTGELTRYRNKAQYPVANGKAGMLAGFFATGTHRIVPMSDCCLQPKLFGEIVTYVCQFCDRNGIRAYEEESRSGLLRHIYLRTGAETGEVMVCLVVNGTHLKNEDLLARELMEHFPSVKSVMLNINKENTNVVLGDDYRCIGGRDYIEDVLCGLTFRISAGAFYQVNHNACELLYGIARERAELSGNETVLDLYCGIGTIGLSMAKNAKKVIGIEIVEEAVTRAAENAARNNIENAYFYCGDASNAEKLLERAEAAHGDVSGATVIMDPPRKGSTPELITYLAKRNFARIVYVSCNPDTLARDCVLFRELGYEIGEVTPVDMFPRTGHVESVVCLTKK
jgi:23S rRNA (uracil1939-C5)-methyltransferase